MQSCFMKSSEHVVALFYLFLFCRQKNSEGQYTVYRRLTKNKNGFVAFRHAFAKGSRQLSVKLVKLEGISKLY